jgi:hypothetical protein
MWQRTGPRNATSVDYANQMRGDRIGQARLCGAIPGVELATGWRFLR